MSRDHVAHTPASRTPEQTGAAKRAPPIREPSLDDLVQRSAQNRAAVLGAISHAAGNQAVCRLMAGHPRVARAGGDQHDPAAKTGQRRPRVRRAGNTLEVLVGDVLLATVTARGNPRSLERVTICDDSYRRPGRITSLRIEVHHPPDLDVDVRLDPKAPADLLRFGITQVDLEQADDGGELYKNELSIWPPRAAAGDDDSSDRISTDEEHRSREDEERRLRRRVAALRRQLGHLEARVRAGKDVHEDLLANKEDQPIVSFFADLIGGAEMPPRSVWDDADRLLDDAARALDRQDPRQAAKSMLRALGAQQAAQSALSRYRGETISGGEGAVGALKTAKALGEFASALVPGVGGDLLQGAGVLAEAVSEEIFESDPVPAPMVPLTHPRGMPGLPGRAGPGGRGRGGGADDGDLVPGRSSLGEFDIDHYGTFANRPGDRLAGHEMLQNLWLQTKGLAPKRGIGTWSRKNPAVALPKPMHDEVGRQQRALGLFDERKVARMTAEENIAANAQAMKRAGVPDYVIETLRKQALRHADSLPGLPVPGP